MQHVIKMNRLEIFGIMMISFFLTPRSSLMSGMVAPSRTDLDEEVISSNNNRGLK